MFATTVIALYLISDSSVAQSVFGIIYLPLTILAIWSLVKAWRTNPGAVPMGARPLTTVKRAQGSSTTTEEQRELQRSIRRCHKCNDNYKPPRAHHDSVTGRCIVKFDHYCPWVGNAVGALNHKFFCLFIGYSASTCIMSIFFIVLRMVACASFHGEVEPSSATSVGESQVDHSQADWHAPTNKKADPTRLLQEGGYLNCNTLFSNYFVIILMIVAVSFLFFTCCMFWEQLEAIESNTSKIARMKIRVGDGGTELERVSHDFNEMFGGDSPSISWHWFLPLDVQFPKSMSKVVLGYEWDPTFGDKPFQENDLVAVMEKKEANNDVDLETGESFSDECKTPSSSNSPNGSLHSIGTKKRSTSKKALIDKPEFVDRTKDRLT